MAPVLIHATCIAIGGYGVLIRGPSGSGKSDLALRCLAITPSLLVPEPAHLIADDQVELHLQANKLFATAPAPIKGLLEIRGVGLVQAPHADQAEIVLVADLLAAIQIPERLPDPLKTATIAGLNLPQMSLNPFEASAAVKLLVALAQRLPG
jgi:HPr kinase/phosphorylase